MGEMLERNLGQLWGCIVIKYEMDIFTDKLRFELCLNENDQYSYFEVIFEGVRSVFHVYKWRGITSEIDEGSDEIDEDSDEVGLTGFEEIYYDLKEQRDCVMISPFIKDTEMDNYHSESNFTIFLNGYASVLSIAAKSITINGEKFDDLL